MSCPRLCAEYAFSGAAFDVAAMRAMRERQLRHLVTPGTINAKYSQGGLVDLEYIVQGLQITHGAADPALRVTNTARGDRPAGRGRRHLGRKRRAPG